MTHDPVGLPPTLPPPVPPPPPRPAFADTWYGAGLLGLAAFVVWLIAAQFIPIIIVLIGVGAAQGDVVATEEGATKLLGENLPLVLFLGALFSAALVGILRVTRVLSPTPRPVRSLGAKAGWTLAATGACLGGSILLSLLLHAAGHEVKEQELLVDAAASGGVWFALAAVLAAPVAEELGFRRLVFSTVRRGAGRAAAYLLSAVLFALVHDNPSAYPLYVWMALCFAFAYEVTGSVWAAVFVHGANNAFSLLFAA